MENEIWVRASELRVGDVWGVYVLKRKIKTRKGLIKLDWELVDESDRVYGCGPFTENKPPTVKYCIIRES